MSKASGSTWTDLSLSISASNLAPSTPNKASGTWISWSQQTSASLTNTRPCGQYECCDALPWASGTSWAVTNPGINDHTSPASAFPGSATPSSYSTRVSPTTSPAVYWSVPSLPVSPASSTSKPGSWNADSNSSTASELPVAAYTGGAPKLERMFAAARFGSVISVAAMLALLL